MCGLALGGALRSFFEPHGKNSSLVGLSESTPFFAMRLFTLLSLLSAISLAGSATAQPVGLPPSSTARTLDNASTSALASDETAEEDPPDAKQCEAAVQESGKPTICSGGLLLDYKLNSSNRMEAYFGDLRVGGAAALAVGDDQRSLYTELISSNLNLSQWGYARIGFGALVSASDNPEESTTADQFFQGGGNAAMYVSLPLAYRFVMYEEGDEVRMARRYDLVANVSIGADLPALSASAEEFAVVVQAGPQFQFVQNATDDTIRLFAQGAFGLNFGSHDFFDNLELEGERRFLNRFFASGRVMAGLDLNDLVRIGVSGGWSAVDGLRQPRQLVVQLIPR